MQRMARCVALSGGGDGGEHAILRCTLSKAHFSINAFGSYMCAQTHVAVGVSGVGMRGAPVQAQATAAVAAY